MNVIFKWLQRNDFDDFEQMDAPDIDCTNVDSFDTFASLFSYFFLRNCNGHEHK